jgi:putative ABC transport system permease protein
MSLLQGWRLRHPPAFSLVALVTLALGIGVTSALFSLVDGVLLKPLPYADADELMMVWESRLEDGVTEAGVSFPNLSDWREEMRSIDGLGGYQFFPYNLTAVEEPERLWGARVTPSVLTTLGVEPLLGRLPRPEEGRPGADPVVVLSHDLWQRRFAADPGITGSSLVLNQQSHSVIGVMPPGFEFPPPLRKGEQTMAVPVELWVPIVPGPPELDRGLRLYFALGRLRPGSERARAQAEIEGIAARLEAEFPDENRGWSARVVPLKDQVVRHVRSSLWLLLGAVGFLLLLVCTNLACLYLARTMSRRQELAIRSALGASRPHLAGLLLREILLLAAAGGLAGLLVARGLLSALSAMSAEVPRLAEVGIDLRVVAFALAVSVFAAVAIGIVPALRMSNPVLGRWLHTAPSAADADRVRWKGRGLLISVELMLALALVVAVGLMGRSFLKLSRVDPGFDPERLLALELQLPQGSYPSDAEVASFEQRLARQIAGLPGVEAVGAINFPPFSGYQMRLPITLEGKPPPASPSERPMAQYRVISATYLDTVSTPVVAGRGLAAGDDVAGSRVALVSETAARRFWPDEDPLGQGIGLQPLAPVVRGQPPGEETSYRVIGVVEDTVQESLDEQVEPLVYVPHAQDPWGFYTVVVRTAGPPDRLIAPIRKEIAAVDETLAVANLRYLSDSVHDATSHPRLILSLLAGFSLLAVALAALGLHGVVSSLMSQRRRELGIRLALGGAKADIVRLLMTDLGIFIAAGLVAGAAVAVGLSRYLRSLLYEVSAFDPLSFSLAVAVMALVALAAVGWPVWRALREDPIEVLRTP